MVSLRSLDLSVCMVLNVLPRGITTLPALQTVDMRGCPKALLASLKGLAEEAEGNFLSVSPLETSASCSMCLNIKCPNVYCCLSCP